MWFRSLLLVAFLSLGSSLSLAQDIGLLLKQIQDEESALADPPKSTSNPPDRNWDDKLNSIGIMNEVRQKELPNYPTETNYGQESGGLQRATTITDLIEAIMGPDSSRSSEDRPLTAPDQTEAGVSNSNYCDKCEKPEGYGVQALAGFLVDPFYNAAGCFSKNRSIAQACEPDDWKTLNRTEKAKVVYYNFAVLNTAHGFEYSSAALTCIVQRESSFNPQIVSSLPSATDSGLGQVVKQTANDLFNRGRWFQSKVSGFTQIKSGAVFHSQMKTSILAQQELILAVYHQKSLDRKKTEHTPSLIEGYHGNSTEKNVAYRNKIVGCQKCIISEGISEKCLNKAI